MLGSSLRMLQFRLGMDGLCRSTKQGGLSFAPARIRVGPNTCFSTAAAAAAAVAGASAAAAAVAAATALRTAGWSCSVFFFFLPTLLRKLPGDGCCCTEPSEKFRVRPRYDYEKKHVSHDSKMCCCCCRCCCGSSTTDERIHAPVLHDASQINYFR